MQLYGMDAGSADRILTTHVGSLIRPSDLISFHEKKLIDEPFEQAAYDACLKQAVAAVVRQQAEIGIDIVSDGEFGKNVSWSRYVLERLSGFEESTGGVGSIKATAGKDRRGFAEFYAEFEAEKGFVGMGKSFAKTGLFLGVAGSFLPVVAPASVAPDRHLRSRFSDSQCLCRSLRDRYIGSVRRHEKRSPCKDRPEQWRAGCQRVHPRQARSRPCSR